MQSTKKRQHRGECQGTVCIFCSQRGVINYKQILKLIFILHFVSSFRLTLLVLSFTVFVSFLVIPVVTDGDTNDYFFCGGLLGMFSSVGVLNVLPDYGSLYQE